MVTSFSPVTFLLIPLILSICPGIRISKSLPDSFSPSLLSYSCSFSWLLANLINWILSQGKDIIFYSSSIKSTFYIKFQFPWEARCGGYFVVLQNQSASVNPQKVYESMFLAIAAERSFLVNNGVSYCSGDHERMLNKDFSSLSSVRVHIKSHFEHVKGFWLLIGLPNWFHFWLRYTTSNCIGIEIPNSGLQRV